MDKRPKSGASTANARTTTATKTPRSNARPSAVITELIKLKSQQKYLDANQVTLNPHKCRTAKEDVAQINELENLKTELEINFAAFCRAKERSTGHAVANVKEFIGTALTPAHLEQLNMKQYRSQVLSVDRLLRETSQQTAGELVELRAEFTIMEDKLASTMANGILLRQHEQLLSGNWRAACTMRHAISAPIERVDSDEVRQFDRFAAETGGRTGAWGDEAHQLFVKLRTRFRNDVDRICVELGPMLTGAYGRHRVLRFLDLMLYFLNAF